MRKGQKKKQVYNSMADFKRRFLPHLYEEQIVKSPEQAGVLGASMARESLVKAKLQFAE